MINLFIFLVFPFALGIASVPPAVVELNNDFPPVPDTILKLVDNISMQKYLSNAKRVPKSDNSMDSYIEAYRLSHEHYQNIEERQTAEISKENESHKSRTRRSAAPELTVPKDFITFELADARTPDEETKKLQQKIRESKNFRMPFEIADAPATAATPSTTASSGDKKSETAKRGTDKETSADSDMHIDESRKIKITHTMPGTQYSNPRAKSIQSYDTLPPNVQKAIDMVMSKEKNRMYISSDSMRYGNSNEGSKVVYYGDKLKKNHPHNQLPSEVKQSHEGIKTDWWVAQELSRKKRLRPNYHVPYVVNPQYVPYTLSQDHFKSVPMQQIDQPNFIPSPPAPAVGEAPKLKYVIKEMKEVTVHNAPTAHGEQQQYSSNPYGPIEAHKYGSPVKVTEYNYPSDGSEIEALSALLGKAPTVQLQGLSNLLSNSQRRPQDSTDPVVFPYDAMQPNPAPAPKAPSKTPMPKAQHKPINYGPQPAQPLPKPQKYTQITSSQTNLNYNDLSGYYSPTAAPQEQQPYSYQESSVKDHTPINEAVYDVADSSPIGPTAAYNSYPSAKGPELPPSAAAADSSDLQYASGYAFGYRVRDFHTGNDFGHTQKRDGDGVTRGEYHILLPDGRVQNVKYRADDDGFHADVSYESVN